MPIPVYRYLLDPTGLSPNNKVLGEVRVLENLEKRAVVPKYGPIFSESLKIYDNLTNTLLIKGTDYKLLELVQSASAKFGKEIIAAMLITNINISNEIRLEYQVLGGLYQFDDTAISNMYDTFLNDSRGVDWENVLNKPLLYPPSLHNHLLEDIYGFEPVIVSLERIRNAIATTDLPAYKTLVDWVNSRVELSTFDDIHLGNSNTNLVTNERLIQALQEFNFNSITIDPVITAAGEGDNLTFNLVTTNLPNNTVLYWSIGHIGTDATDFNMTSGVIQVVNNRASFNVSLADNTGTGEQQEEFTIYIRKNGIDGHILAKTPNIILPAHGGLPFIDLKVACCIFNPSVTISPESFYLTREY